MISLSIHHFLRLPVQHWTGIAKKLVSRRNHSHEHGNIISNTDDDQIETAIAVQYRFTGEGREQNVHTPQMTLVQETTEFPQANDGEPGHGVNIDDNAACCKEMAPHGLVDCLACLDEAWATFSDMLDPESRIDAIWILDTVRQTKEVGVRKSDLLVRIISPSPSVHLGFTSTYRHSQGLELHEYHFSSIN